MKYSHQETPCTVYATDARQVSLKIRTQGNITLPCCLRCAYTFETLLQNDYRPRWSLWIDRPVSFDNAPLPICSTCPRRRQSSTVIAILSHAEFKKKIEIQNQTCTGKSVTPQTSKQLTQTKTNGEKRMHGVVGPWTEFREADISEYEFINDFVYLEGAMTLPIRRSSAILASSC